jgi:cytochrome c oxidase subunit 2
LIPVLVLLLLAGTAAACGSESSDAPTVELSAAAEAGREVARDEGCMSCHREEGGGVGPAWAGLAGSEVELADGSTVIADEEYLRRSIVEPNAQIVKGYSGIMPERRLDEADVDAIVTYLQELGAS